MDLQYFINVLWKRKWLLVTVGLITAIATFFLVGLTPYKFKSRATIETGVLNNFDLNILNNNIFQQQFITDAMFAELLQLMKSKPIVKLLSEELLYHDLSADGENIKPFRIPEENEDLSYSAAELEDFMTVLASSKDTFHAPQMQKHNRVRYIDIAEAFEYDYEELVKHLEVKRLGESDFISIEFTSENPDLSYFAVQKFCDEFLNYYESVIINSEDQQVTKFKLELEAKEEIYKKKTVELNQLREKYGIIDSDLQTAAVIDQIAALRENIEKERQEVKKQKKTLATTTREIKRIAPEANRGNFKQRTLNQDLDRLQAKIKKLNNKYLAGGRKDKKIAKELNELRKEREDLSKQMALFVHKYEKLEDNRLEDLLGQKVAAEIDLEAAKQTLKGYEKEYKLLVGDKDEMLENNAEFNKVDSEWLLAYNDYKDAKNNFKLIELDSDIQESPLKLFEAPEISEKAEPKNRAILGAFAGVTSGILTTVLLFLLAFFDGSFNNPTQFKKLSSLPLLGTINNLKNRQLDLESIFGSSENNSDLNFFKESIRKLRFAVESSGAKNFLITSTKTQEGKSFLTLTLAYALSLNNRRVLVIDGNFKNNSLSAMSNISDEENPLMTNHTGLSGTGSNIGNSNFQMEGVDIIGNAGDSRSASEVLAGKNFRQVLSNYELDYDYVLIEAAAMNEYSDARELSQFVDKVILVTNSESKINNADKESFAFLSNLGGRFYGSILNKINIKNIT